MQTGNFLIYSQKNILCQLKAINIRKNGKNSYKNHNKKS